MCGIVGFATMKERHGQSDIDKMLAEIKHRGPDFQDTYHDKNAFLGHARLSILDLTALGNQPMCYKNLTIVFNGEIYNYIEIKKMLTIRGHRFRSNTDTEVILHAYEEWGEDCLTYFRGMWAFVIYDSVKRVFFGSRDRFGIKPFYYIKNNSLFAFASEIKPLLMLPDVNTDVNFKILSSYLVINMMNFDQQTFFKDVNQLNPGTFFIYKLESNEISFKRYYSLENESEQHGNVTFEDFESTLNEAFQLHIRSDVPLGSCLSGGLDSSTVVATIANLQKDNTLRVVTAQSESQENDESHFAKIVVEHLGIEWNKVKPTYRDFREQIDQCLYMQEEPVGGPSIFMQYNVMKHAQSLQLKIMMDGQGGDEALLGYERYYTFFLLDLLKKGSIAKAAVEYAQMTRHSKLTAKDLLKYFIYFTNIKIRKNHLTSRNKSLYPEYLHQGLSTLDELEYNSINLKKLQLLELTKTNLPSLLKNEDRNSMAASIEARVPFVDHKVIEKALMLSASDKIHNGYTKYSLRKYIDKKLPKSIVWRKDKRGFEAPTDLWVKNHWDIIINEVGNSKLIREMYKTQPNLASLSTKEVWKLYNLSIWERQFFS